MSTEKAIQGIPKSGKIVHNPILCRGCGICELACSAYHDGECSTYLSRIHIEPKDLELSFPAIVCAQCNCPSCYQACPLRDSALCIDERTGARYINEPECTGCGACADACPLPEAPIWQRKTSSNGTFFKCDLCKDREDGPLCVEVCPRKALVFETRGK